MVYCKIGNLQKLVDLRGDWGLEIEKVKNIL